MVFVGGIVVGVVVVGVLNETHFVVNELFQYKTSLKIINPSHIPT